MFLIRIMHLLDPRHPSLKLCCFTKRSGDRSIYGDWRVEESNRFLLLSMIEYMLVEDNLQTISFNDIAWVGRDIPDNKKGENCSCCNGMRYKAGDIEFPCKLLFNAPYPFGLEHLKRKYRLLDGKHRIHKMIVQGKSKSLFYVIDYNKIKNVVYTTEQIKDYYHKHPEEQVRVGRVNVNSKM